MFRVKSGTRVVLDGDLHKSYRRGDVFESSIDYAKKDKECYEEIPEAEAEAIRAGKPQPTASPDPEIDTTDLGTAELMAKNVEELRSEAEDMEVDIAGLNTKEEIVAAIIAAFDE